MTTVLLLLATALFALLVLRIVGHIMPWRYTLPILAAAVLITAYGINTAPAWAELGHAIENLFGGPQ